MNEQRRSGIATVMFTDAAALFGTHDSIVRDALLRHPSPRRRSRAVPIIVGENGRVLAWIDAFG